MREQKNTVSAIADQLGISRTTLYRWKEEGCDISSLDEVKQWVLDRDVGGKEATDEDVAEARKRKTIADAEKAEWDARIKELKAAKEEARLIDKVEVAETLTGIGTRLKGRFLALAGELPPKLAGLEAEEMEEVIEKEVNHLLEELAKEFEKI